MPKVEFLLYTSDNKSFEKVPVPLPKGGKLTKAGIESLKVRFVEALQESFPGKIFRFVQMSPRKFKIFHEDCPHCFNDEGFCNACNMEEPKPMVTLN